MSKNFKWSYISILGMVFIIAIIVLGALFYHAWKNPYCATPEAYNQGISC
jgi:heme/copper-type cytochrome/quinol oxidase subunit 2